VAEEPDAPVVVSPTLREVLGRARTLGLLGPPPLEEQVRHARGFGQAAAESGAIAQRALDLGSGGGLPGLVLADDAAVGSTSGESIPTGWTLLDARAKSTTFLEAAVVELKLTRFVTVREGRAEVVARSELRGAFDLVCARGFGAPAVTAECAVGFLRRGGLLVVSDPPGEEASEERWPSAGLGELGLERLTAIPGAFRFRVLRMRRDCPERFPRRIGIPQKRPIF
jgi:16S rRNA (guanine527-N7)-methyltransferase